MPLYEYQCRNCKAVFEKIQKFSDPPLLKCENCGGRLERLLSSPAFQFKGSGWYVTDYARKAQAPGSSKTSSTPETEKSSDGDGKGTKSSDGDGKGTKSSESKDKAAPVNSDK